MNNYRQLVKRYFEEILASGFVVAALSFVFVNMLFRVFMGKALWWPEEAASICLVWVVFLGMASVYKRGIHIGVDLFIRRMPGGLRRSVDFLLHVILLAVNGYLLWLSIEYITQSLDQKTAVLGISYAWSGSALFVSFVLTTWHSVVKLMDCLKKFS